MILDHVGNVTRHGFPDDSRDWSLDDRMRRSKGTPAPSVRTCPECFAAFKPQPQCPICGAQCVPIKSRVIRELAGELQELKRAQQRKTRREQGQARTLPELMAIARQRGYSPAWAWKVHNVRSNAQR